MTFRVQWTSSGLERLIEILDFIAEDSPVAARQVVDSLLTKVEILAEHPRIGAPFSKSSGPDIRRLVIGRHIVVYQVQESKQLISIIAVRSSRQRPLELEELIDAV